MRGPSRNRTQDHNYNRLFSSVFLHALSNKLLVNGVNVLQPCRQLTLGMQTSKYHLGTQLPAASSEPPTLSTSSQQTATVTSLPLTMHSLPTSTEPCLAGAAVISPLVTSSSALSVTTGLALTTVTPPSTISCSSSTSTEVIAASVAPEAANMTQASSYRDDDTSDKSEVSREKAAAETTDTAPGATSDSVRDKTVHSILEILKEDSSGLQKRLQQPVKEGDNQRANRDDLMGATHDPGVNDDRKTVTAAADEGKPQQMSAHQAPANAAAAAVDDDDSGTRQMSSEAAVEQSAALATAEADEVIIGSSSMAVSRSHRSDSAAGSNKLPATLDSDSCPKADVSQKQTAPQSTTTSSGNKDDERYNETDIAHIASDDVSHGKTAAETNEKTSGAAIDTDSGDDKSSVGQMETGMAAAEKADLPVSDEVVDEATKTSLKEQQLRQIMTLPAQLLSHVNPSLPISLSLTHRDHQQVIVPAADIYQSKCGLRLLLPADSLPVDCVNSRQQLLCTLGPRADDDAGQLQQIAISLTLC